MKTQSEIKKFYWRIDVFRFLGLLLMILCHCIDMHWSGGAFYLPSPFLPLGFEHSGIILVFSIGALASLQKNKKNSDYIKRGVILIFLGYLTNYLRFIFPLHIATFIYPNFHLKIPYSILDILLTWDILQFAGIFFLCLPFIKKFSFSFIFSAAIFIFLFSNCITPIQEKLNLSNFYYLWIFADTRLIPFSIIPWISFSMLGYCLFPKILMLSPTRTKKIFYLSTLFILIFNFLIFFFGSNESFSQPGFLGYLFYLSCTFFWLSLCLGFQITEKTYNLFHAIINLWCRRITFVWFYSWLFIILFYAILPFQSITNYAYFCILITYVFLFTHLSLLLTEKISSMNFRKNSLKSML